MTKIKSVWIVKEIDRPRYENYSTESVMGVFSSEANAKEGIEKKKKWLEDHDYGVLLDTREFRIDEYQVDIFK